MFFMKYMYFVDLMQFRKHPSVLLIILILIRIPKVTVSRDEGLVELEISDDPYDVQKVEVRSAPCIVTVCKVNSLNN
jgi:hypothetical protein